MRGSSKPKIKTSIGVVKKSKKSKKMDPTEKGFNKGLMREIKQKQKALKTQGGGDADSMNDRM